VLLLLLLLLRNTPITTSPVVNDDRGAVRSTDDVFKRVAALRHEPDIYTSLLRDPAMEHTAF